MGKLQEAITSNIQIAKSKEQYKGKCFLWKDRLVIDGKEFTTAPRSNLTELPQDLQPRNTAEKQNDNILCFLVGHCVFSNVQKAPFQVEGTQYSCTEQYIQCSKTQLFDDDLAHHRIMKEMDPYKLSKLVPG